MPAALVTWPTPVRRTGATLRRMTASFVLHLQSGALADGDVCGVVEIVATGERHTITTLHELGALLVRQSLPRARTAGVDRADEG
jgi:hypothetical protein